MSMFTTRRKMNERIQEEVNKQRWEDYKEKRITDLEMLSYDMQAKLEDLTEMTNQLQEEVKNLHALLYGHPIPEAECFCCECECEGE